MRIVAAAARVVRLYALALAVAAALIVWALYDDGDGPALVLGVVAAVALAFPPVVLFLFSNALRALAELPGRIRALPGEGRGRAEDLRRLGADLGEIRGRRGLGRALLLPWRLTRLSAESRALLMPYAPVLPLVSVGFLGLAGLASLLGLVELALGLVALVDVLR